MSTTFIVDSNRLSREGMVRLLGDTNFEVLGHAGDLEELDSVAAEHGHPELLLLDLPRETEGLKDHLVALRERAPDMKVVILTTSVQPRPLAEYFGAGVDGYLLKDISTEALIGSLNLVLAGERVFPSQLIPLILRGTSAMPTMANTATAEGANLSDRELQILGCLGRRRFQQDDRQSPQRDRGDDQGSCQKHPAQDQRAEPHPGGYLGAEQWHPYRCQPDRAGQRQLTAIPPPQMSGTSRTVAAVWAASCPECFDRYAARRPRAPCLFLSTAIQAATDLSGLLLTTQQNKTAGQRGTGRYDFDR